MNELLKQLAVDAGILHDGCSPVGLQDQQLTKFAELIVLEACNVLHVESWNKGKYNAWVCSDDTELASKIKARFGS